MCNRLTLPISSAANKLATYIRYYTIIPIVITIFAVNVFATRTHASETSAKTFQIYDATLFEGKPNLQQHGLKPIPFVYAGALWPDDAVKSEPNEPQIRKIASRFNPNELVVFNIEHWILDDRVNENEAAANIEKLKKIADIFHDEAPGVKMGYYTLLPKRNYWDPVKAEPEAIAKWKALNKKLSSIGDRVDAIFPSLYTFYGCIDDQDYMKHWAKYASANIAEAKQYGKPVYPVLWFQYHDSNELLAGRHIDSRFWLHQLQTVLDEGADGVVIWGGYQSSWDPKSSWWQATLKFISNHNLIKSD